MPDWPTPGQDSLPPHDEPTTIRALTIHPPWSDLIALEDEALRFWWLTRSRGEGETEAGKVADAGAVERMAIPPGIEANEVECGLTNKQIRRGVHKSLQALEKDIRTWIAHWNTNPRPYVWTKTADEILERLASYLKRIPDSEH